MTLYDQLSIWWQLLKREMVVFMHTWYDFIINSLISAGFMVLLYGSFLPALGMPYKYRIPLFLGTVITFNLDIGYNVGMLVVLDLRSQGILKYHLSLPAPAWLVMSAYVFSAMIRITCITAPIVTIGLVFLGAGQQLIIAPLYAAIILPLIVFAFSLFFLVLGVGFRFESYVTNVWPRLLAPLFSFGSTFYTWKRLSLVAPVSARFLLINPLTYCTEGVRSVFLGGPEYFSPILCAVVIAGVCCVLSVILGLVVRRRIPSVGMKSKK